jgi:hypothetical protein
VEVDETEVLLAVLEPKRKKITGGRSNLYKEKLQNIS